MTQNDREVRKEEILQSEQQSNVLSEAYKSPLKTGERSEEYNILSNSNKGLKTALRFGNRANFITSKDNFVDDVWRSPGTIPEQERLEIIQTGFQRQAEGKISLKKYYQSADPYSLFQSKGYSIKYESIRRTKLYQKLK